VDVVVFERLVAGNWLNLERRDVGLRILRHVFFWIFWWIGLSIIWFLAGIVVRFLVSIVICIIFGVVFGISSFWARIAGDTGRCGRYGLARRCDCA
jgi:hypothetical protein